MKPIAKPWPARPMTAAILRFLKTEAGSGSILILAAALAMIAANTAMADAYFGLLKAPLVLDLQVWRIEMSVKHWVKDGLMAVFFYVIGLELKREWATGELSNPRTLVLPAAAAIGGAAVPILIYLAVAGQTDTRGWPIPIATDVAFALAALALLAPRADTRLRVFLLTLAVVDDLIAVALIAVLFTAGLSIWPLAGALALLALVALCRRWADPPAWSYALVALVVWALAIESGVHSSVLAVAAALIVPIESRRRKVPVLERLEDPCHSVSAFVAMPAFAFVAAGISFKGMDITALAAPTSVGIALGLALGKPLGVGAAGLMTAQLLRPPGAPSPAEIALVGLLCGIGFTMSLFIGALAFEGDTSAEILAKVGVLAGSLLSLLMASAGFALRGLAGGRTSREV